MADILRNFIYRRAADPMNQPRPVLDPGIPGDPTAGEGYIERPTTGGEKALAAILPILGALQGIQPRDRETGKVRFDVGQAAQGVAGGLLGGLGNIHERKLQEHQSWWQQQQAAEDAAFKTAGLGLEAQRNDILASRRPPASPQPEGPPVPTPPPSIEEHRTPSGGILTLVNGKPVTPYREKPEKPTKGSAPAEAKPTPTVSPEAAYAEFKRKLQLASGVDFMSDPTDIQNFSDYLDYAAVANGFGEQRAREKGYKGPWPPSSGPAAETPAPTNAKTAAPPKKPRVPVVGQATQGLQ